MPVLPLLLGAALAATPIEPVLQKHAPAQAPALLQLAQDEADALVTALGASGARADGLREAYQEQLAANLWAKDRAGFPLDAARIDRTIIRYERFKLQRYVTAGVFPKRYFGYVDLDWDTAADEATMMRVAHDAAAEINAWLGERGTAWRVTDAEIIVTFIAEGGALLLGERNALKDQVHPIYDIGLDDIASGSSEFGGLITRLDRRFGTGVGEIVTWVDGEPYLSRHMTFEEAVLGTALMWVWEKEICAKKLAKEGRPPLEGRPPEDQFILGSLVYNSGILFSEGRLGMIRDFRTGGYLDEASRANVKRRTALNLLAPDGALQELAMGLGYRDQLTSWNAVYHIMQRWGGYAGIMAFTDVFTPDGALREVPPEPPPPQVVHPEPTPVAPAAEPPAPTGCATTRPPGLWLLGLYFIWLATRFSSRRLVISSSLPRTAN
ncbi:MAG: hypothetical protein H6739_00655 [Alphaproteobacteria bacterium]|nr:hypothetical protein [Alphaproteobacteria bacterium]